MEINIEETRIEEMTVDTEEMTADTEEEEVTKEMMRDIVTRKEKKDIDGTVVETDIVTAVETVEGMEAEIEDEIVVEVIEASMKEVEELLEIIGDPKLTATLGHPER